jgi:DnaA family protein
MSSTQLTLPISQRVQLSFDNFVLGEHQQLIDAIKSSVNATQFGLVYFYGLSGAGKSHLHYALGAYAQTHDRIVQYVSFKDEGASISLSDKLGLLEYMQVQELVCLDDLDVIAGDLEAERAVFSVFERCKASNGRLLVSATTPPKQMGFVLPDLVSRLASADVFALAEMNDDLRVQAVHLRAQQLGLKIPQESLDYLISRLPRDNASLFGFIETLDKASLQQKRRITIPFLKSLMQS